MMNMVLRLTLRVVLNTLVVCICIHGFFYGGILEGMHLFAGDAIFCWYWLLFLPGVPAALALVGVHLGLVGRGGLALSFLPALIAALLSILLFLSCLPFLPTTTEGAGLFSNDTTRELEMLSAGATFFLFCFSL